MSGTRIDYADETWNVVTGCQMVSKGCAHCWAAKRAATRLQHRPAYAGLARRTERGRYQWTGDVRLHPGKLPESLHWRRPRVIFVAPMGDLFHEAVPDGFIDRVFAIMALAPQHQFLILTKRTERIATYLRPRVEQVRLGGGSVPIKGESFWPEGAAATRIISELASLSPQGPFPRLPSWPLQNVYLGTSVEDQETADRRLPELVRLAAQGWKTWVSLEPQIGPVELGTWFWSAMTDKHKCAINWLVQGCESGPNARPFEMEWARSVRDQCLAAGVPYYLKQVPRNAGVFGEWISGGVIHVPELDGQEWLETPW